MYRLKRSGNGNQVKSLRLYMHQNHNSDEVRQASQGKEFHKIGVTTVKALFLGPPMGYLRSVGQ